MPKIIRLNDLTSHGGKVVSVAVTHFTIGGIAVACVGDKTTCPVHGPGTILEGDARHTKWRRHCRKSSVCKARHDITRQQTRSITRERTAQGLESDALSERESLSLIQESPDEARKRWQHEVSPKSFHGSIFGSAKNHRNVTAYDLSIGGGLASSDPTKFCRSLCAVADWRLQTELTAKRPSILQWEFFRKIWSVLVR